MKQPIKAEVSLMEVWKDVPGYEGSYRVSNTGRVLSVSRKNSSGKGVPERILAQSENEHGYKKVCLSKDGAVKTVRVHRLVAALFVDNPHGFGCVNHIDENKENNRADNLEWCNHEYNANYGGTQKRKAAAMDYAAIAQKKMKPVAQFDLRGNKIREYSSVVDAATANGFCRANIAACARGKIPIANKHTWRYI